MVPSDYRLEQVTKSLIERLEATRRAYGGREDDARSAFEEAATAHVRAAVAEYQAVAMEDPKAHAAFLDREIRCTALPRYHRLAMDMNRAEGGGYGFGWLAEPVGRFALIIGSVVVAMMLLRVAITPYVWPLILLTLTLPVWPTVSASLVRRRYQREVQEIVWDMGRIQDAERTYLQEGELKAASELTQEPVGVSARRESRPSPPERE